MSVDLARQKIVEVTGGLGMGAAMQMLHALFPNDFEVYLMAFELEDSVGYVTDRFIFPILPDSISYDQRKITNIQKTAQGVSVLTNNSFVPRTISMNGTFGKWFKTLIGNKETSTVIPFIPNIKTGYGSLKQLERLIDKSTERDVLGRPNRLVFYNLSFNTQYVVKVMSFNPSMSMDSNMMWRYNLELTAVSPAIFDVKKIAFILGMGAINEGIKDVQTAARVAINSTTPLL